MKVKYLISTLALSSLAAISFAAPLFQAGNITEGKKVLIDANTGIASYFANGNSGQVQFSCQLDGDIGVNGEPKAVMRPGKNFENGYNLPLRTLSKGMNGPFNWTLTDQNADVGNIKIFYSSGSNVSVQCVGQKL